MPQSYRRDAGSPCRQSRAAGIRCAHGGILPQCDRAPGARALFVATEQDFPDALSAAAAAAYLGGPLLLTPSTALPSAVFPQASQAFIATGRTFPDALAATGAAGSLAAPVILVDGARSALATETLSLLSRLGVSSVAIAGGPGAVSGGIQSQLSQKATTVRHGGASRYETASSINDAYFPSAPAAFVAARPPPR